MKLFANVVHAFQEWLMSFSVIRMLQPFAMYIMFGSLGVDLIHKLIVVIFHRNLAIFDFFDTIAYFGVTLGLILLFLSKDIKWAPYGIFAKVLIILIPFNYFALSTVIKCGLYIWFAIALLRYTAINLNDDKV